MVLNGGEANGHRIVSSHWLAEATRPTGGPGPGYGYQWWMGEKPGSFQAIGLQGQFIYIDPATRTVVVKLSYFPPGDMQPERECAAFFTAASAWLPH
jgi:CubicO group peptidase (beta-lactamase class C family)